MHSENAVSTSIESNTIESKDMKFTVGTRDKEGNIAIFHADAKSYEEAMQMVKSSMIEEGIENPVVFANVKGV